MGSIMACVRSIASGDLWNETRQQPSLEGVVLVEPEKEEELVCSQPVAVEYSPPIVLETPE